MIPWLATILIVAGLLVLMAWLLYLSAPKDQTSALVDSAAGGGGLPRVLVRVYRAPQQSDATATFQTDAARLAEDGYRPVSQSWAQGQWGCGAWLVALLLSVFLIGLLVFLYMLIVKPDGTLTVTYELVEAGAPRWPESTAPASVRERLAQLDELHSSGVVSDEEYAAKRAKIIDLL